MAAKTPTGTALTTAAGSLKLQVFTFTDIDDADTWTSGLNNIVGWWLNATDDATSVTSSGIDANTTSNGVFKFNTDENSRTAQMFVLSRELE
jgi:hypothetical protein